MKKEQKVIDHDSNRALRGLAIAMLVGGAGILVYSMQFGLADFLSVISVGALVAGASLLLGGLLGFIFGIPRTLQNELDETKQTAESASNVSPAVQYRANTNLEQISDWLTKMLVGVGLTQLTVLPDHLKQVTTYIGSGLGDQTSNPIFALSILLFYSVAGFLYGYLWTRLYLAGAFRSADLMALGQLVNRVEETDRKIETFKKQSEIDAEALNLVSRKLNTSSELPDVSQDVLNEAILSASRPIKIQIFNQAWRVRSDNWRNNKPLMERTIPIFRALINSDVERRYHMNHGQLGFALKDQRTPDWAEAEKELTIAINMRGPWQERGWIFYEFNRAVCRIMLDENFLADSPAEESVRTALLSDLRAAAESELYELVKKDDLIQRWIRINNISENEF